MLLSRSPLTARRLPVRLACFMHAASVYPEPGSNSPFKTKVPKNPFLVTGSLPTTLRLLRLCLLLLARQKSRALSLRRTLGSRVITLFASPARESISDCFHAVKPASRLSLARNSLSRHQRPGVYQALRSVSSRFPDRPVSGPTPFRRQQGEVYQTRFTTSRPSSDASLFDPLIPRRDKNPARP